MARAMRLTVITEGVEEWSSALAIRNLGCDFAQGYLFSPPVDLAGALALARRGGVDLGPMPLSEGRVGPVGDHNPALEPAVSAVRRT